MPERVASSNEPIRLGEPPKSEKEMPHRGTAGVPEKVVHVSSPPDLWRIRKGRKSLHTDWVNNPRKESMGTSGVPEKVVSNPPDLWRARKGPKSLRTDWVNHPRKKWGTSGVPGRVASSCTVNQPKLEYGDLWRARKGRKSRWTSGVPPKWP